MPLKSCSAVAARASVVNSTNANLPLGSQRASRTCVGWRPPVHTVVASSNTYGGRLQHTGLRHVVSSAHRRYGGVVPRD
eukprot:scaffold58157_cov32-Phaeocystis_antarctica.AAC.2